MPFLPHMSKSVLARHGPAPTLAELNDGLDALALPQGHGGGRALRSAGTLKDSKQSVFVDTAIRCEGGTVADDVPPVPVAALKRSPCAQIGHRHLHERIALAHIAVAMCQVAGRRSSTGRL